MGGVAEPHLLSVMIHGLLLEGGEVGGRLV
jgi:hypothetical protein